LVLGLRWARVFALGAIFRGTPACAQHITKDETRQQNATQHNGGDAYRFGRPRLHEECESSHEDDGHNDDEFSALQALNASIAAPMSPATSCSALRVASVTPVLFWCLCLSLYAQTLASSTDEGWLEVPLAKRGLALLEVAEVRSAIAASSASLRRVNFLAEGDSSERAQLRGLALVLGREKDALDEIERMLVASGSIAGNRRGFTKRLAETRDALRQQRVALETEQGRMLTARTEAVASFAGLPFDALAVRRNEAGSEATAVRRLVSAAADDERVFRERVTSLSRGMATHAQELLSLEQELAVAQGGLDALARDHNAAEASAQTGTALWGPRERECLARIEIRRLELACAALQGDALEVQGLELEVVQLQQDEAAARRDVLSAHLAVLEAERAAAAEVEDKALAAEVAKLASAAPGSADAFQMRRLDQRLRTLRFELELEALTRKDASDGERAQIALRMGVVSQGIAAALKGDAGALPLAADGMHSLQAQLVADAESLVAIEDAYAKRLSALRLEPREVGPSGSIVPEGAALDAARDALALALENSRAAARTELLRIEAAQRELGPRALWMRTGIEISWECVDAAASDLGGLPGRLPALIGSEWQRWWSTASAPAHLRGTILALAATIILLISALLLRRRLPATFSWMEAHQHGTSGRLWRLLAAWLRRTDITLMLALGFVIVRLVSGQDPFAGPVAVVAMTPFAWQGLRSARALLLDPQREEDRALQVSTSVALALHRTTGRLIVWCLATVPIGLLLERTGYAEHNPGFVDLWWLITSLGSLTLLLAQALRPGLLSDWVRGQSPRASALRGVIAVLWPIFTCSLVALIVLHAARYESAAHRLQTAWLEAGLLAIGSGLIYALLFGNLLGRLALAPVRRDEYEDVAAFAEANARRAKALLQRMLVRALVFGPAMVLIYVVVENTLVDAVAPAVLDAQAFKLGAAIGASLVALAIGIVVIRHMTLMLRYVLLPRTQLESGVQFALATLATYLMVAILLVIVLRLLQVEASQIAWALTALSLGVGFGLQDLVRSSAAGIMLLVERPLKVGDELHVEGQRGTVEDISLRATRVRLSNNTVVVIPNQQLQSGLISGRSERGEAVRLAVRVGVAYGTDLAKAALCVRAVLAAKPYVRSRPAAEVLIDDAADSAVMLLVWFWVTTPGPRERQESEVREGILERFRQEGIAIPFPQMDVRVVGDGKVTQ